MPENEADRKWYHKELPQIMYRITRFDLDDLPKVPHEIDDHKYPEMRYKEIFFEDLNTGQKKDTRSPFMHGFSKLPAAQTRRKTSKYKKELNEDPGSMTALDFWGAAEVIGESCRERVHDLSRDAAQACSKIGSMTRYAAQACSKIGSNL